MERTPGRGCGWRWRCRGLHRAAQARLPASRTGGENLVQRTPRRTRVRALYGPGSDGTPAGRRPLRLGVDDNPGKCPRAVRTFGTIVLGGTRGAVPGVGPGRGPVSTIGARSR